jgi:hypothetical protein
MRAPGLEPWWARDTTVHLTIQPQVGSHHVLDVYVTLSQQARLMHVYVLDVIGCPAVYTYEDATGDLLPSLNDSDATGHRPLRLPLQQRERAGAR